MQPWMVAALVMAGAYLLGAVPFGILLTRMTGAGDLRTIGSGNIGATNVLRTGRKGLAAATLILDAAKGAVAVLVAGAIDPVLMPLAGAAAFLGHCYPAWLRFRGGKGVATLLGIALALHWPTGLVFAGVWIAAVAATRISSAGGIAAAVSSPVMAVLCDRSDLLPLFLALALIVLWKHRDNVTRMVAGTEPRVGAGRVGAPGTSAASATSDGDRRLG